MRQNLWEDIVSVTLSPIGQKKCWG